MAVQETDKITALPSGNGATSPSRLVQWAFSMRRDESVPIQLTRSCLRVCIIMYREFFKTNISLRASALTYSIILSMVPLLAMSTAVLKGLGSDNQLKIAAYRLIDQFDPQGGNQAATVSETKITPNSSPAAESSNEKDVQQSLTRHLRNAVDTIFKYVERTNFAALGAFGIAGLLVVVVLVLSTVEKAMNAIWHTKKGRSLFRKVMDYLALLILLPISINVALAGDAILESPKMMEYINTVIPSAWAVKMLLKLLPFLFIVLTLMVMYLFFPNTKVRTYAAFTGAIFASVCWFIVQKGYIILQLGVAQYNAIYGSFATIPLFLVWLHLGWTFILLGATLAYSIQNRNQYHLSGTEGSPQRRLQLAFDILQITYDNFARRKITTVDQLIDTLPGEQRSEIGVLTSLLVQGNLLNRTGENDESFVPAAPAANLNAAEIVRLILGRDHFPSYGGRIASQIVEAAEAAVKQQLFTTSESPAVNDHAKETGPGAA